MPDRVLILASEFISDAEQALPEHLRRQARQTGEVLVIAPVLTTWLQCLASDTDAAHAAAEHRVGQIAADISRRRRPPHTEVGDENQLLAVADALAHFAADACIVVNHDHASENYHERGVAQQIADSFQLPTTVLTVNSNGRLTHHETL
jgi:hypothetical protein